MGLWIPVTVAAAVFQTARFMLQKILSRDTLTASGATWARFIYSAPVILPALALYAVAAGGMPPMPGIPFWIDAAIGGAAQVVATLLVVTLFASRNFAVGITFKKTEVIQTAILGYLVLGDTVSPLAGVAIAIGLVAVVLLSKTPGLDGPWWRHLAGRASALGLGSGVLFAFSAVFYRSASLRVEADDPVMRAGVTLAAVVVMQALGMGLWLAWRDRAQIAAVWNARRQAGFVGLTSMGGSFCWFLAFTLQNAAYVKALGQVELLLSMAASALFFKERISARELAGIGLLAVSILVLLIAL